MSDIKTVILDGTEIKVEGLRGQNTAIVNQGSSTVYVSVNSGIEPDKDNVAAILAGGAMNLYDTHGTIYLFGMGKVQLRGTDYNVLPVSATVSGNGGGGGSAGSGVSQEYVDSADAVTLNSAKNYTDSEITAVNAEIASSADETLAAAKEYADAKVPKIYDYAVNAPVSNDPRYVKMADINIPPNGGAVAELEFVDAYPLNVGWNTTRSDEITGKLYIGLRIDSNGEFMPEGQKIQWVYANDKIIPEDLFIAAKINDDKSVSGGLYLNLQTHYNAVKVAELINTVPASMVFSDSVGNSNFISEIPAEYTIRLSSTVMPLLNIKSLQNEIAELKAYIGYTQQAKNDKEADGND